MLLENFNLEIRRFDHAVRKITEGGSMQSFTEAHLGPINNFFEIRYNELIKIRFNEFDNSL